MTNSPILGMFGATPPPVEVQAEKEGGEPQTLSYQGRLRVVDKTEVGNR